jgi:hypothetical protein
MTIEDLDGVNATVLLINLKTGVVLIDDHFRSTGGSFPNRKHLVPLPAGDRPAEPAKIKGLWVRSIRKLMGRFGAHKKSNHVIPSAQPDLRLVWTAAEIRPTSRGPGRVRLVRQK